MSFTLPGQIPHPTKAFIYVESAHSRRALKRLFDGFAEAARRLGQSNRRGSIGTENVEVVVPLPEPTVFQALSMNGDVSEWRAAVIEYAQHEGLLTASVHGNFFVLSDCRQVPVSDCAVARYSHV